jgi:hypothetical protein
MSASVCDRVESPRNASAGTALSRAAATERHPVLAHCLRITPRSPLPSDFERAVMDTAAHARDHGACEALLRARCRSCALGGGGLLALAVLVALWLPTPWLAVIPTAVASLAGWRWAVYAAAADELRADSAR